MIIKKKSKPNKSKKKNMAYQNLVQAQRGQSIAIEPIVLHLQKKKKNPNNQKL